MHQTNRQSSCNECNDVEKKLQEVTLDEKSDSITGTEDLSNEIFYEIFDYLDGCDIFKAFFNLNTRFQDLLNSSFLLLKFHRLSTSKQLFQNCYKNFINPNRERILSLVLWHRPHINSFFYQYPINPSFNRLESLTLKNITSKNLVTLYPVLSSLTRLVSLTIRLGDRHSDLSDVYQMIFHLIILKYYKLSTLPFSSSSTFSLIENRISSTLEHLVIHHDCTSNELLAILSCTSHLRRLACKKLIHERDDVVTEIPVTLPHLTHVSIDECDVQFDEFKIFITKICFQLEVLCVNIKSDDEAYVNESNWKRLISRDMPQLRKFNLTYIQSFNEIFRLTPYYTLSNLFNPSILPGWKCLCDFSIYKDIAKYSIYSYKDNYSELYDHNENNLYTARCYNNFNLTQHIINRNQSEIVKSSIPSTLLTIKSINFIQDNLLFDEYIQSFLSGTRFTHLNIDSQDTSVVTLIKLIHLLPHVHYLKVTSMTPPIMEQWSTEQAEMFRSVSNNNNITKLHVTQLNNITETDFLVDLCSRIEYFEVECTNNVDLELLVVSILINQNINCIPRLRTLCVRMENENDELIENLQQIIDVEKLLENYSIKRIGNTIILHLE